MVMSESEPLTVTGGAVVAAAVVVEGAAVLPAVVVVGSAVSGSAVSEEDLVPKLNVS